MKVTIPKPVCERCEDYATHIIIERDDGTRADLCMWCIEGPELAAALLEAERTGQDDIALTLRDRIPPPKN